jgi:SulP family sulfate permease
LADNGFAEATISRLMDFLERVEFGEGQVLICQGDEADDLYFLEMGRVSVYLEREDGSPVRLRTLETGTVVGELGLYLPSTRTASVIAEGPTTAYRLTQAAPTELRQSEPELAAAFHELVARLLSDRLVAKDRSLEASLR